MMSSELVLTYVAFKRKFDKKWGFSIVSRTIIINDIPSSNFWLI